tara:strand:+ start:1300 stop:1788 length:489 start_codon:yes stop_codon:yes gene_type:complete
MKTGKQELDPLPDWFNQCGIEWVPGPYGGFENWRGKLPGSKYDFAEVWQNEEGTWGCLAGPRVISPREATRDEAFQALLVYLRLDVPVDAESISSQFRAELQALLKKYDAEIEASDHYLGYPECGEDIRMIVSVPSRYSADGDRTREGCDIDLGESFKGDES